MMNRLSKYLVVFTAFIFLNCHYRKDELVITNNTNDEVCYETLAKNKKQNIYFQASAGGKIKPHGRDSPLVRGSIKYTIQDSLADNTLYIVFYNLKEREYIYKNINNLVGNGKYIVRRFSRKELDKKKWMISYAAK